VNTRDVLRVTGVTYRQLDYWARMHYVQATNEGEGSGAHRVWPDREVRIVALMARLTEAGLTVPAAHLIARGAEAAIRAGDEAAMEVLAPGIVLVISAEASERRRIETLPRSL
jgi:DNA-binding transcriptional MerR regulator